MSSIIGFVQFAMFLGTLLAIAFMVCLSIPQSKLRDCCVCCAGWALALFCGFYFVSPVDVLPEALLGPLGLLDDLGAIVIGIASAIQAYKAGARNAVREAA